MEQYKQTPNFKKRQSKEIPKISLVANGRILYSKYILFKTENSNHSRSFSPNKRENKGESKRLSIFSNNIGVSSIQNDIGNEGYEYKPTPTDKTLRM